MTALTDLAKGKLQDPILMDWALDRYREAQKRGPQYSEAMEHAWFDDLALRRWLERDDDEILSRLLRGLPPERFEALGQAIAQRWSRWNGDVTRHAAPLLARYHPDLALNCFLEWEGTRHGDSETLFGILRALPWLPRDKGAEHLRRIAKETLTPSRGLEFRDLLLGELLAVGLQIDRTVALEVLKALLLEVTRERDLHRTLAALTNGLFGHGAYLQLASDIRQGLTRQRFVPLAALFQADAPLEELDRMSEGAADLDVLAGLAERHLAMDDRPVVRLLIETTRSSRFAKWRGPLADFLVGGVAAACEREHLDLPGLDLHKAVALLAADLSPPRHLDGLVAHLRSFEPDTVASALLKALEAEKDTYGGVSAAMAMGQLGETRFVEPLTAAMNEDGGDLLCEAANESLIRIGNPARDYLIAQWDGLDDTQRIYGLSVIRAVGGEPAATFAVTRFDDLFAEDPESCCYLARSVPDPRLLAPLEKRLGRRQLLFDETFYLLARLLDVEHPGLEEIGERVRQQRAQQKARRRAMLRGEWFQESLSLELRCPKCGDVNRYEVRRVAIDPSNKDAKILIADEHPCASCGQWVEFELAPSAYIVVTGELMGLAAENAAGLAGRSKVLVRAEAPLNGRSYPVGEVVSRCEAALAEDPTRVADWLRLGFCYHRVLSRPRYAQRFAEKALELVPQAAEARLQLADALSLRGDAEGAFRVLDEALAHKDQWRLYLLDVATPAQFAAQFAQIYNELLRQLRKPDRPMLHAAFLGASRKVGRNDPCPCGSGKKYKRCCLSNQ